VLIFRLVIISIRLNIVRSFNGDHNSDTRSISRPQGFNVEFPDKKTLEDIQWEKKEKKKHAGGFWNGGQNNIILFVLVCTNGTI